MSTEERVKHWEENDGVEILKSIGVKKDDKVIDFGCGFGQYSFSASKVVQNQGMIYALDKNKKILKYVETVAEERNISNITTLYGEEKDTLNFDTNTIDCILFYDILHGENIDRFAMIKEAHRVLKSNGILSILPFHLSNFRDENGKKKKYKVEKLIKEVCELGFIISNKIENKGIHFEKYHSPHYIKNGGIDFDDLERGTIINFLKV